MGEGNKNRGGPNLSWQYVPTHQCDRSSSCTGHRSACRLVYLYQENKDGVT